MCVQNQNRADAPRFLLLVSFSASDWRPFLK